MNKADHTHSSPNELASAGAIYEYVRVQFEKSLEFMDTF